MSRHTCSWLNVNQKRNRSGFPNVRMPCISESSKNDIISGTHSHARVLMYISCHVSFTNRNKQPRKSLPVSLRHKSHSNVSHVYCRFYLADDLDSLCFCEFHGYLFVSTVPCSGVALIKISPNPLTIKPAINANKYWPKLLTHGTVVCEI